MLQSSTVNSRGVKDSRDHVNVRIIEVIRDKDALYVRYTVSNPGQHPYRVSEPEVYRFTPSVANTVAGTLKGKQIPDHKVTALGDGTTANLIVREDRISNRDVNPGQSVDGVLCFKADGDKPHVYRFVFANDQSHPVDATAVL